MALVKLKELSQDERLRELAISREKLAWDIASRERGAKEEGREEAQRAIARNLLKLDLPLENIAQATGLSLAEIQQLQAEGQARH
jgi:predicted transposase/invertase (TIGR01784 family)